MKRGFILFAAVVIISLLCVTVGVYSDSQCTDRESCNCSSNHIAGSDQGICPDGNKSNCQGDKCNCQGGKCNCQGDKCNCQGGKKCNCQGGKCNCQGGKCNCQGDKCNCQGGKKCNCQGDKCNCQGGKCNCQGDKCNCQGDKKSNCQGDKKSNCQGDKNCRQTKCPCGGSCNCCEKCECGSKCVCAGTCVCCDKCKCVIPGAGFLSGKPHIDGPNLIIENDYHKNKTVVLTGNTLLYPQNLDLKTVKRVNVHFTIKSGLSQALEVYDAKYSWVAKKWDNKNKRYHYFLEKKKI